jgi:hypothetical protein
MAVIQYLKGHRINAEREIAQLVGEPILAFSRWVVRAFLAVVLFAVAISALVIVSLAAMYSDHRVAQ